MELIIANNRRYTTEVLSRLVPDENDIIGICNFFLLNKLPHWKGVKYYWFVRNIQNCINDRLPFEQMIAYLKPVKIFYVNDTPKDFNKEYAISTGIPFQEVRATNTNYPRGKFASTGFAAALSMPKAILVGFENIGHYSGSAYHHFQHEHKYINKNRQVIVL